VVQDPSLHIDDHRSNPTAVEHRRAGRLPPPHHRPTASVSPVSTLPARRLPGTPAVLAGSTLAPMSRRRAADECATARGDHIVSLRRTRVTAGHTGRFPRWAGLPGRGPADFSTDRAWQATMPRGL
jgi:hypothetical protein